MKYRVVIISPGPKMTLDEEYFTLLSEQCEGDILTSSTEESIINRKQIGSFKVKCIEYKRNNKLLSIADFVLNGIKFAYRAKKNNEKYDLVTTYDPLKSGVVGVIVSKMLKVKFISSVNGVYTSDAEYLDTKDTLSTKLKRFITPLVMKFVLKNTNGIKLLFDSQIDVFEKQIKGKKIARFPNYVPIERFSNIREDKEILFVGFPFKRKGVDILIEAFKKITDQYPDWKLKILGWFQDRTELDKAIDNHPRIDYYEPVYYKEMPNHIGTCGIFVLPSRSEAMGRVLVESMAAGKARIGSNVDGIPTVINDNVDGLLVEPCNAEDLAEKFKSLIEDDELRKRLGKNAEKRAMEEFTKDVYFKNLFNFYKEVVT
ncbi:MAG: glycosyltransferase family 4 protein [Candidatus Thiodiazotropha lotti]|nr:glycosyltransferase family 4 protein [Candidatus Thiodiazotropha lotti]